MVGFVAGRAGDAAFVEHMSDALFAVALQRPLENLADHLGGFRVDDDVIFVGGVLFVTVDGKASDVLTLPALQVEDHADIFRKVLQVPLVDQAVDLAGFFVALDLRVGVVRYGNEANAPDGKQAVDVLLHQLHVPGEAGLGFAEDDMELLPLRRGEHPIEVRPEAVGAGVVLVAVDGVDVPAVINGVRGQQGLLVLDALGLGLVLVFILLAQACIDCAENLLHLLEGVTARYYGSIGAAAAQEIILNTCAENSAQASFVGWC